MPVVAVGVCFLNSCAGTKGKHHYDPITYASTPTFSWSDVSRLDSGCCEPVADSPVFAIQNYPGITFRVLRPGEVRIELLCQDSSFVGTLFDSTMTSVGWSSIFWSGRDSSGIGGPTCEFICRVILPDSIFTISYGPRENYPNPFSSGTVIPFTLADSATVSIAMHNVNGVLVRHLIDSASFAPGTHRVYWDGRDDSNVAVSTGIYLCKLYIDGLFVATKKTTVIN